MDYLALAMAGILYGGVVFGGKLLANMGATLSDVMLYPNLISMLVVLYPARRDAAKIFGQPRSVTLLRRDTECLFFLLSRRLSTSLPIH